MACTSSTATAAATTAAAATVTTTAAANAAAAACSPSSTTLSRVVLRKARATDAAPERTWCICSARAVSLRAEARAGEGAGARRGMRATGLGQGLRLAVPSTAGVPAGIPCVPSPIVPPPILSRLSRQAVAPRDATSPRDAISPLEA